MFKKIVVAAVMIVVLLLVCGYFTRNYLAELTDSNHFLLFPADGVTVLLRAAVTA